MNLKPTAQSTDVIIVGHGPSVLAGLGALIDEMTVIRVKHWPPKYHCETHFGTRCDYLVVKEPQHRDDVKQWLWRDGHGVGDWWSWWLDHRPQNKTNKPSHGLIAAMMAMHYLKPQRLHVIGFDRIYGNLNTWKYYASQERKGKSTLASHDWAAEKKALDNLGIPVINLGA